MAVYVDMSPWLSDLLLRSQTDERLIALSQLGHKRAFELIVERYRRPLTAYAHRLDPQRAEDLVQQTFVSALSALQRGTEVRHLRGWLYEILRNQVRRDAVGTGIAAELDEADSVTDSAQLVAERRMLAVDALGAVAQLPARQQDAIVQMAFLGMSRTEVADSMGVSEGAVRQLVHRARAAIRTAVTAITPMPILRWLCSPRSGPGTGLAEAALGAGTTSSAGIALKVGVAAIVASGVVAGGVISVVSRHHRSPTVLASRSHTAGRRAATTSPRSGTNAPGATDQSAATSQRAASGVSTGLGPAGGRARFVVSRPGSNGHSGSFGPGRHSGPQSGSRGPEGADSGSSSGPSSGDGGGSDHGSGGPGSGDRGTSGSDGGGTGSARGGGFDDGSAGSGAGTGSDGSGSTGTGDAGSRGTSTGGNGGTDGGGGPQPLAVSSGDGMGASGSDGGPVGSWGGSGAGSGGDGGGSGSDAGSSSNSGSE